MKKLIYITIVLVSSFLIISCTSEPDPQKEAQDVVEEMEEFVMAVENKVENRTEMAWDSVSSEFDRIENTIERSADKMESKTKEKVNKFRERYRKAEDNWKSKLKEMDNNLETTIDSIDSKVELSLK